MTNIIDLYKRLTDKYYNSTGPTKKYDELAKELNTTVYKGTLLKDWGFLKKGERWRNKDLQLFFEELGYSTIIKSTDIKYIFIKEKPNKFELGNYRCNVENHPILPFGEVITIDYIVNKNLAHIKQLDIYINIDNVKSILIKEKSIIFKNRRELIEQFEQMMSIIGDNYLEVKFYKIPDFKELFENPRTYNSIKEYKDVHTKGELRTMKGHCIIKNNSFKKQDNYLLMKDIEDDNILKSVNIQKIVEFTYNNITYSIDN